MNNSKLDGTATAILDVLPCDWMESASQESVKHQPSDSIPGVSTKFQALWRILECTYVK